MSFFGISASHLNANFCYYSFLNFRYLDFTLLKDKKFIAMSLSVTLMSTGCPYMLYFLPAFALSAGNLSCFFILCFDKIQFLCLKIIIVVIRKRELWM